MEFFKSCLLLTKPNMLTSLPHFLFAVSRAILNPKPNQSSQVCCFQKFHEGSLIKLPFEVVGAGPLCNCRIMRIRIFIGGKVKCKNV